MATPRQQQHIGIIKSNLVALADLQPESVVQKERLGSDLSFEFMLPMLEEITAFAKRAARVDLEKVPYHVLAQIDAPLTRIVHTITQQIITFRPSNSNQPALARQELAHTVEDSWGSIFLPLAAIVSVPQEALNTSEFEKLSAQIRTSVQLSSDASESLRMKQAELDRNMTVFLAEKAAKFDKDAEESLIQLNRALEQVRNAAGEAGVSQTAVHFKHEAGEHLDAARRWFAMLVITTLMLLLFSLFGTTIMGWVGTPVPAVNSENIIHVRYFSQKSLIIFCIVFALIWAARNYSAARHNYVVNKHRNNALGSFQAFVASAADDQTKNAVLIQATQSVFSPQASGYIRNDGENSANPPILEIVRSIGGHAKDK